MNIIDFNPHNLRESEVTDLVMYVVNELDVRRDEGLGAVETAQVGVNSVTSAFGRLVDILAKKGILSAPEVAEIATGIRLEDAMFVEYVEEEKP